LMQLLPFSVPRWHMPEYTQHLLQVHVAEGPLVHQVSRQ
jgi:hypothetical protein